MLDFLLSNSLLKKTSDFSFLGVLHRTCDTFSTNLARLYIFRESSFAISLLNFFFSIDELIILKQQIFQIYLHLAHFFSFDDNL
jgi:hypothetical protein